MARFNASGWAARTLLLIMISVLAFSIRCGAAAGPGRTLCLRAAIGHSGL